MKPVRIFNRILISPDLHAILFHVAGPHQTKVCRRFPPLREDRKAFLTPAAIPGVFLGCLLSNILGGCVLPDIIFGSLATLIGAVFTWMLRNHSRFLAPLPPIIANTVIVPFVLKYAYMTPLPIPFMMLTVGIGEVISCGVLGLILHAALGRYRGVLFAERS